MPTETGAISMVPPVSSDKKSNFEIMELFRRGLTYNLQRRVGYAENTRIFLEWEILDEQDYGNHRVEIRFGTRFCRTHAGYILRDRPNIQVPPQNPSVPQLRWQSSRNEMGLNLWWDDENVVQKLKRGVLTASYKWDYIWFLNVNKEKKCIHFQPCQPDFFDYDRISTDPDSPLLWVMRVEMYNTDALKLRYPGKGIQPSGLNTRFLGYTNFVNSDLYNLHRTCFIEFMDHKYIYRYANDVELEVIEHGYPFIPFYIFQYFDVGKKWGMALMDFIRDPIKKMNQLIGYQFDQALKVANPPLVIIGGNADVNADNVKWGKISIPTIGAVVQYLQPPMSNLQMDKMVEQMKQYVHFMAALNEESMAGFSGALTAAGVSIELRMDSTVREAIDVQLGLQNIIQRINSDYLKLFEKFFPSENLLHSQQYGDITDQKFEGSLINQYYRNIVDFGGILPRSNTEIVRNVLAKYQQGLISLDTALEELRYADPTTEKDKIRSEKIETANLQRQIETWTVEQKYFENPKAEEDYMLTQNKLAMPHPNQDHELFIKAHMERYKQVASPLFIQNILMRKQMQGQAQPLPNPPQWPQAPPSQGFGNQAPQAPQMPQWMPNNFPQ